MNCKRGMSGIVVTLIIIGIALAAVGVVWFVINEVITTQEASVTEASGQVFQGCASAGMSVWINGCTGIIKYLGGEKCCGKLVTSCKDILDNNPGLTDGVYTINPNSNGEDASFSVYCDMTNGGWTRVLNAVTVSDWNTVRVNENVVLSGTSDSATNSVQNGWIGVKYWNNLGNEMREDCEGASAGSQSKSALFSLNVGNNYAISWPIGGNWNNWHNGMQLSTKDYDRDLWSSACANYGGHESSGWGWHRSCHIGSAWFGSNGKPICHVVPGATYSGTISESDHVQWFIR